MRTIGEMYGPAMEITEQAEADRYFKEIVDYCMGCDVISRGQTREQIESIQRSNLAYYSGYYPSDIQRRVERLFGGVHPVFGPCPEPE